MYVSILGRQPALGAAELESVYGPDNVRVFSHQAMLVDADTVDINRLGGSLKTGHVTIELQRASWRDVSQKLVNHYSQKWHLVDHKVTVGISVYGYDISFRDVQRTSLALKQKLKGRVSLRIIPNTDPALSTATSHHNKLGLSPNKVELLVVQGNDGSTVIAESTGSQNITAYVRRDQGRPKRDAFVGMLPPKLAQIMINLAADRTRPTDATPRLLDPFCGTGVLLQEAALLGYAVYGTDLNEKMVHYTRDNLNWLKDSHRTSFDWYLHEGDAMTTTWQQPINVVVCETYLGQPFSAPPSPSKLQEVRGNCNHIISEFLKNLAPQLTAGSPICVAVPAWRSKDGSFTHLPLIHALDKLGYKRKEFADVADDELLYYREDQVVARELLVLTIS